MAFVAIELFQTPLTAFLSSASTTMKISAAAGIQISSALAPGDFTVFSLSNGVVSEIVHCTGMANATTANILRAQEGSMAQNFAVSTPIRFVWTTVGIQAVAGGGSSGITITDSGAADVTGGPYTFNVDVPLTTITAGTGIGITGPFPNFVITNTSPGSAVTPTIVTGSGTAVVTAITGGYNVAVGAPNFINGIGIAVTGAYPNYTITNTAPASGGTGTVTSVTGGTGVSITGTPTIAPVVNITPTGVAAGTYGALTVNVRGQITAIASNLLTSITSANSSITVSAPSAGVATITAVDGTTSQKGVLKLAVASSSSSSDPGDSTSAVSPAGIAAVLAAQTPITIAADTNNIPLASASYTNPILTSSLSLNLVAGKTAIVTCNVEVCDPSDATLIPTFGIGLFNALTFIDGISDNMSSSYRTLTVKLLGPFTGIVNMATTTLTGSFAVQSKSMTIVTN